MIAGIKWFVCTNRGFKCTTVFKREPNTVAQHQAVRELLEEMFGFFFTCIMSAKNICFIHLGVALKKKKKKDFFH